MGSNFGLYDMLENVWEWCQDWLNENYYRVSPKDNPQGPPMGEYRVSRGGSWFSVPSFVRCANRGRMRQNDRRVALGFRLVSPGE